MQSSSPLSASQSALDAPAVPRSSDAGEVVIQTRDLNKTYRAAFSRGGKTALDNLTIDVKRGEIFGLVLWTVKNPVHRVWQTPIASLLIKIGIMSYSLYAFHLPFLVFLRGFFLGGQRSQWILAPIVASAGCVALALVVFWLIERWSLKVPTFQTKARVVGDPIA